MKEKFLELRKLFGNKTMVTDTIADIMARLQNGIMRRKGEIVVPVNKMSTGILEILKNEEMIADYERVNGAYTVRPLYRPTGEPVVSRFKKVSKSGQRLYIRAKEIVPVMNGRGISIISTSEGLMTGSHAKSKGVGGELICEIF